VFKIIPDIFEKQKLFDSYAGLKICSELSIPGQLYEQQHALELEDRLEKYNIMCLCIDQM
jgi:hypothetical protein